jgi:hypothetical protein
MLLDYRGAAREITYIDFFRDFSKLRKKNFPFLP